MPAGDHKTCQWEIDIVITDDIRVKMRYQMINANKRYGERITQGPGYGDSYKQRTYKAGALSYCYKLNLLQANAGLL